MTAKKIAQVKIPLLGLMHSRGLPLIVVGINIALRISDFLDLNVWKTWNLTEFDPETDYDRPPRTIG